DKMILKINDKEINLSKNEFLILEILMENPQKIVSREAIMDKLWATDSFIDDNTLTVNINRLRKKLKNLGLDDFIQTKKGVGYFIK
ncbi:MAG: winged helix-turn-helix domain-containing protein, partial [Anaerococcus vaginalis]